jgi:hypothetical protein
MKISNHIYICYLMINDHSVFDMESAKNITNQVIQSKIIILNKKLWLIMDFLSSTELHYLNHVKMTP